MGRMGVCLLDFKNFLSVNLDKAKVDLLRLRKFIKSDKINYLSRVNGDLRSLSTLIGIL